MPGSDIHSEAFTKALYDYFFLVNRNYQDKLVLKIVGDRHKLSGETRTVLFRGVFSQKENQGRSHKLTLNTSNQILHIDFYNMFFTLLNYKLGRLVFISTDRYCRDAGSLFGKIRKEKYFTETALQTIDFFKILNSSYLVLYIDSPVSFSKEHKFFLESQTTKFEINCEIRLVKSADKELKAQNNGIICTTDSAIIDATNLAIADLGHMAIKYFYEPQMMNLSLILEGLLLKNA